LKHINFSAKSITIQIKDADPHIFNLMLECMYTSQIKNIGKDGSKTVILLLRLAKQYEVSSLRFVCENLLHSRLSPREALSLFPTFPDITESVVEDNIGLLIHTPEFSDLPEECLLKIVKSSTIDISEMELFRAIIKWGVKECIRKNLKDSPENRREVLKNILLHIRFPVFTTEQIASDIRTSGVLLDHQMVLLFTWLGKKAQLKGDELLAAQNEFQNENDGKFPWLFEFRGSKTI